METGALPLSYTPKVVEVTGFEPATPGFLGNLMLHHIGSPSEKANSKFAFCFGHSIE